MVQTDLKSDNFCGYNTAAAPFYWTLDPVQNHVSYNFGEVGVSTGVGLHTPASAIDVSSMIVGGGRDNVLTSCNPPVPALSPHGNLTDDGIRTNNSSLQIPTQGLETRKNDLTNLNYVQNNNLTDHLNSMSQNYDNSENKISTASGETIKKQQIDKSQFLLPNFSRLKGSAKDLSAIDFHGGFSGNKGNLHTNPQDLTHVIERMWLERGGLDSNQIIKESYEPWTNNTYKNGPNRAKNLKGLNEQYATCDKIRQPYNIKYAFGIPPGPEKESKHFNAIDVTSLVKDSPILDQNPEIRYNENAIYNNGGCNKISFLKDNKMCNNHDNDLTGINNFNYLKDVPPQGI
jgi:hypothetical protein